MKTGKQEPMASLTPNLPGKRQGYSEYFKETKYGNFNEDPFDASVFISGYLRIVKTRALIDLTRSANV